MKARRLTSLGLATGTVLALATTITSADGDVEAGRSFARENCARCHNVEPGGPFKQHPPSFASIAMYRSEGQIRGRMLFPPLHSNMPQLGYMLVPENVDNVLAYILSLEEK